MIILPAQHDCLYRQARSVTSCWGHLLITVALQSQSSSSGANGKALQAAPAKHALGMTSHHPNLRSSAQNVRRSVVSRKVTHHHHHHHHLHRQSKSTPFYYWFSSLP